MTYQQIVNRPVRELSSLSYEDFVDLITGCIVQIFRVESEAREAKDFDLIHELAEKHQQLMTAYENLKQHSHYPEYKKRMETVTRSNLDFQVAA